MKSRILASALVALLGVALLAGCGGGSGSGKSTTSTTGTQSTTGTEQTSTGSSKGGSETSAAVSYCEHIIATQTKIPAKPKHKLEGACKKIAEGDASAVKVAEREVCEELATNSDVPSSAVKDKLRKACQK